MHPQQIDLAETSPLPTQDQITFSDKEADMHLKRIDSNRHRSLNHAKARKAYDWLLIL